MVYYDNYDVNYDKGGGVGFGYKTHTSYTFRYFLSLNLFFFIKTTFRFPFRELTEF